LDHLPSTYESPSSLPTPPPTSSSSLDGGRGNPSLPCESPSTAVYAIAIPPTPLYHINELEPLPGAHHCQLRCCLHLQLDIYSASVLDHTLVLDPPILACAAADAKLYLSKCFRVLAFVYAVVANAWRRNPPYDSNREIPRDRLGSSLDLQPVKGDGNELYRVL
jgi:hypothetical protein